MTLDKRYGIGFVLLLAFTLRVTGIGFGLPYIYHQDEPIIVNHALAIGAGGWNTHFFVIPPFTIYLLFVAQGIYFVFGKALGLFHTTSDFALMFMRDPSSVYLLGRFLLGVCFGTGTVWALWVGTRRFFGEKTAFWAALFLAMLPVHVQHSHYIYADIPLTFVATLFYFALLQMLETPVFMNYARMGALLGLAVATKYTALYFTPLILLVHGMAHDKEWHRPMHILKLILSCVCCVAVFLILAPFTLLDWRNFWGQLSHQSGAEGFVGLAHHAVYSIVGGSGFLFVSLSAFGLFVLARTSGRRASVTAGFVLIYYFVNACFSQRFARYMLPLMPVLALLSALGLQGLNPIFEKRRALGILVAGAVCLELLAPSVYSDALFLGTDTRTECARWFHEHVKAGSAVAVDNRFFGPHLSPSEALIKQKYSLLDDSDKDSVRKKRLDYILQSGADKKGYAVYQLIQDREAAAPQFLFLGPFVNEDWGGLKKIGAEYVVIHTSDSDHAASRFIRAFPAKAELLCSFSPYRDPSRRESLDPEASTAAPHLAAEIFSRKALGPYLEVYRIKDAA